MSALSRMVNGDHKSLTVTSSDTVIISATPVPGNEKSVQSVINALSKIGCTIHDRSTTVVHVSGHGSQEELKLMLAMTRPRYFMPVHGEAVHLRAHAKLGEALGIPRDHIFIADNGDMLEMSNGRVRWGEPVESGVVYVDGLSVTGDDPVVFRDRQKLASDGIVTCVVTVSRRGGRVGDVAIASRGVTFDSDELIGDAQRLVKDQVSESSRKSGGNLETLRKAARNSLSNYLWDKTHTRPMVIPIAMEV